MGLSKAAFSKSERVHINKSGNSQCSKKESKAADMALLLIFRRENVFKSNWERL